MSEMLSEMIAYRVYDTMSSIDWEDTLEKDVKDQLKSAAHQILIDMDICSTQTLAEWKKNHSTIKG